MDKALCLLQQWHAEHQPRAYFLALSGGRDSMALLALLADFRAQSALHDLPFHAIYVDHQWHSQSALWGTFCLEQAKRFGFTAEVVRLNLSQSVGESLEAMAREGRYQALAERLPEGGVLLTAHHQDDQVETFFLQLMRGAGLEGLSCMPFQKRFATGALWRPLLSVSRETIEAFIHERQLPFLDDPSNEDTRFQRNLWRHELLPILQTHFPHLNRAVSRSVGHLQSALHEQHATLMERYLQNQSALSVEQKAYGAILAFAGQSEREKQLLRFAIAQAGVLPPPQKRFEAFCLGLSGRGHSELHWGNWALVEHQAAVYLYQHRVPSEPPPISRLTHWQGVGSLNVLALPTGVEMEELRWGLYPCKALWHEKGLRYPTDLKNVFQNKGVPPYLRRRLPLLFLRNQLAWIGLFGTAQGFDGLGVEWQEKALSVKISAYQLPKS